MQRRAVAFVATGDVDAAAIYTDELDVIPFAFQLPGLIGCAMAGPKLYGVALVAAMRIDAKSTDDDSLVGLVVDEFLRRTAIAIECLQADLEGKLGVRHIEAPAPGVWRGLERGQNDLVGSRDCSLPYAGGALVAVVVARGLYTHYGSLVGAAGAVAALRTPRGDSPALNYDTVHAGCPLAVIRAVDHVEQIRVAAPCPDARPTRAQNHVPQRTPRVGRRRLIRPCHTRNGADSRLLDALRFGLGQSCVLNGLLGSRCRLLRRVVQGLDLGLVGSLLIGKRF